MPDVDTTATGGVEFRTYRRGALTTDGADQYVVPVRDRIVSYQGRGQSFRIPGLAGTTGQKLAGIFNAAGSSVLVSVTKVTVDVYQTAARVVAPPLLRMHRITALPTGGAVLPKVPLDTAGVPNASVTLSQGASADGTGVALVSTIPASSMLSQEPVARALTLVGYEQFDRTAFFEADEVTLRAGEGLIVNLDYTVATSNPITDMYVVGIAFEEYTRP